MEGSAEDLPVRAPRNAILAVGIVNTLTRAQPEVHSAGGASWKDHVQIDSRAMRLLNVQYTVGAEKEREEVR